MEEVNIASEIASGSVDFSFFTLFLRADWVVKSVIIILILASIYSWNIIISKIIRINRHYRGCSQNYFTSIFLLFIT